MAQQASQAGGVFGLECRAIVPNGSARSSSGGVLGFSAVSHTGYDALRLRSIGDNRSTMTLKRRRLRVFRLLVSQATVHSGSDRLGTIDLPWLAGGGVLAFLFLQLASSQPNVGERRKKDYN